jgi:hypothetical protein
MPSWQLDRKTLEKDMLRMNEEDGVHLLRPYRAKEIKKGDGCHLVEVSPKGGEPLTSISAKWIIDATGRKRLFNRTFLKGNLQEVPNPNTASFWIRVKDVDRRCFSPTVHDPRTITSPYFSTNHFFGHGYWIWMIPLASGELSIGIVCDKDLVDIKEIFKQEKFIDFLKAEHRILYNLCTSGEIVDCLALYHLPYRSKRYYDASRWALIGDAAAFVDPFYSVGLSLTSIQICQVTRMIELDLVEKTSAKAMRLCINKYNSSFDVNYKVNLTILKDFYKFSDDPRAMQEKIRFDQTVWFKVAVPEFVNKFFLEQRFLSRKQGRDSSFVKIFEKMNELFIDLRESSYCPEFIETMITKDILASEADRCVFEAESSNPFGAISYCYMESIRYRIRLLFGIYRSRALLKGDQWKWIAIHFLEGVAMKLLGFSRARELRRKKRPSNTWLAQQRRKYKGYYSGRSRTVSPRKVVVRQPEVSLEEAKVE